MHVTDLKWYSDLNQQLRLPMFEYIMYRFTCMQHARIMRVTFLRLVIRQPMSFLKLSWKKITIEKLNKSEFENVEDQLFFKLS